MKLFSTNRNARGRQLVCEDAVFDPNLIMTLRVDVEEKVVSFSYDFADIPSTFHSTCSQLTSS